MGVYDARQYLIAAEMKCNGLAPLFLLPLTSSTSLQLFTLNSCRIILLKMSTSVHLNSAATSTAEQQKQLNCLTREIIGALSVVDEVPAEMEPEFLQRLYDTVVCDLHIHSVHLL